MDEVSGGAEAAVDGFAAERIEQFIFAGLYRRASFVTLAIPSAGKAVRLFFNLEQRRRATAKGGAVCVRPREPVIAVRRPPSNDFDAKPCSGPVWPTLLGACC